MFSFPQAKLHVLLIAPPGPFKTVLIGLISAYFIAGAIMGYSQRSKDRAPGEWHRLTVHAALMAALCWILCGAWRVWSLPLSAFILHLGVNLFWRGVREKNGAWFIGLHGTALFLLGIAAIQIARIAAPASFWVGIWGERYLKGVIFIGGFATIWFFCAEAVGHSVRPLLDQMEAEHDRLCREGRGDLIRIFSRRGLEQAGAIIGKLERSLILIFILGGHITAIGFLVAAKSIFRFGELKDIENRMESEYITIGTLISFVLGIGAGYAVKFAIATV